MDYLDVNKIIINWTKGNWIKLVKQNVNESELNMMRFKKYERKQIKE